MPDRKTIEHAEEDKREGKSPSAQAGEFVSEEMHHREGKHGARSTKQAIAIGLSEARRAGVELPPPEPGTASEQTRHGAERNLAAARKTGRRKVSRKRSRAVTGALRREGHSAASKIALSKQAKFAARRRSPAVRSAPGRKAARTKGAAGRSAAGRKAARARSKRRR